MEIVNRNRRSGFVIKSLWPLLLLGYDYKDEDVHMIFQSNFTRKLS